MEAHGEEGSSGFPSAAPPSGPLELWRSLSTCGLTFFKKLTFVRGFIILFSDILMKTETSV